MKQCLNCGASLRRGNQKYCSNKCQQDYEYKMYIQDWKSGVVTGTIGTQQISGHVKRYLREIHYNKCQLCGWGELNIYTGIVPLEVHHIDNDPDNNTEDNLELLCPNCHSLTGNWKGANKKNSKREYRRKQK